MPTSRLAIGSPAPDFKLPAVDGKNYALSDFQDKNVLAVLFTCNHCPYVQAYEQRLIAIQSDFLSRSVSLLAINSNETKNHPEDSFPNMVTRAKKEGFNFPYLRDETQEVADAYGAHYTPEVFLFDKERKLRFTGRIDDNWRDADKAQSHDLRDAIEALLAGKEIKNQETHATGCTIKWAQF